MNLRLIELENGDFDVKRGVMFAARISFDGPRGSFRTHEGHLYADEWKEVYRLHRDQKFVAAVR